MILIKYNYIFEHYTMLIQLIYYNIFLVIYIVPLYLPIYQYNITVSNKAH